MKWIIRLLPAVILAVVVSILAYAGDQSSPALNAVSGYTSVQQMTAWKVLFRSSQADGAAVANPYAWSGWTTAARESSAYAAGAATPYVGGRLLLSNRAGGEYEIWCLFSTAGASATLQLFALNGIRVSQVPSADRAALVTPGTDTTVALGLAYPVAADAGLRTFSALATADAVKIKFSSSEASNLAEAYPNESGGTTYYVAPAIRQDWRGGYGVLPYVTSLSGGTLVIVGRTE